MYLSKKVLCALEAVLDIALHTRANPMNGSELTRRQNISRRYLERMMQELVRADILTGQRGPHGGYRLARERRNISVADIFTALNENDRQEASFSLLGKRVIDPLCAEITRQMIKTLEKITIEELVARAKKDDKINRERQKDMPNDFTI